MYKNDGVLIKGNKDGINITIDMKKFADFNEMLEALVKKLSRGKDFYKGTTLILKCDMKNITKDNMQIIKDSLLKEIELKEHTHIFSHIQWNMKGTMLFVEQKTDHFYSIDEIEEKYAIPSAFVPFYTQVKQIIERELV